MAYRKGGFAAAARLTNMSVSVDKIGNRAQVCLPGFTFEDFDRSGNLSPLKLQRLLTMVRFYAYHTPNQTGHSFLDYDKMTSDRYTFMASTQTEISRDYYEIPTLPIIPKLAVNIHLGYIGNSSLSSVAELVDKDSGKIFATNVNQVVTVSKETRKPVALPDWWKEQYKDAVIGNHRLVIAPLQKPDDSYEYSVRVSWSDIDGYKHTNYVTYVRFCLDAAMDGIHHDYFSKLKEDITKYHVKKFSILFKGESVACDELKVHIWENAENPYILHFEIQKEGQPIHQNTIEFHEPNLG